MVAVGFVWIRDGGRGLDCMSVLLHPVSLSLRISYLSPLFSFFQSLNLYLSVIFTCLVVYLYIRRLFRTIIWLVALMDSVIPGLVTV
jgi:hypothetical protein